MDYDSDDDGLIEVANLAQLNAIRWDTDGDGASSNAGYASAFPHASSGMGCPQAGCDGYELTADLDFDSDGDGDVDADDHSGAYWNGGKGWEPFGILKTTINGNGYTIANLFIARTASINAAQFGLTTEINSDSTISQLGLLNPNITITGAWDAAVGAITGYNAGGTIEKAFVIGGQISGPQASYVGAIAGEMHGKIENTYSQQVTLSSATGSTGGLVGTSYSDGMILTSYSTNRVAGANRGGILGQAIRTSKAGGEGDKDPDITDTYWDKEVSERTSSATSDAADGKTTSDLQTPVTATGIYAGWDADIWEFGTASHYPVLKDAPAPTTLTADIEAQTYTQGVAITDLTLPVASGGDSHPVYTYALAPTLPAGLSFTASTRILSGTPTEPSVKVSYTYTATESGGDDGVTESDSTTFTISVAPEATTLTGAPGNGVAHLSWTAIAGVGGWGYLQNEKGLTTNTTWTAITGSGATTAAHTVTGLDNSKEYDFKVRAVIGSDGTLVNGVESNKATVDVADQTPALTGTIADQALTQGASYTSATAFPAGTGGDAPLAHSVASLPDGITLNDDRKLTGTHTSPLAKTSLTYTVTDAEGDSANANDDDTRDTATLTFNISVAPQKPADFTAAAGDAQITLGWTAIAGVAGWEVKQDSGSWTAITGSGAATNSHEVTGLTNGTTYTFKVRAYVGAGVVGTGTRVDGVESDDATATPSDDLVPVLETVTNKLYVQGAAVDETLPAATGGDGDGHPSYAYTFTPDVSDIGLTFTESTLKLGGTPSAPKAQVEYTYTATETSDSDGATESTDRTFTIGIQPEKPASFSATAGDGSVTLGWTAIDDVTGWEVQQDGGSWTAIADSGAATNSHTVTGLKNGTAYTFMVRAVVGIGDTLVNGVESDAASATTDDLVPVLETVANKLYVQGAAVDEALPAATGGDSATYAYTLTPDVTDIGLTFTESTRKLGGTPSAPKAKVSYTYTATESSDPDGTTESDSKTFTIGIQPKKPAGFSVTGGNAQLDGHSGRIRLGVQAGLGELDGHRRQRRDHRQPHGHQPRQRDVVHLQGARPYRQRQHAGERRGVGRQDGEDEWWRRWWWRQPSAEGRLRAGVRQQRRHRRPGVDPRRVLHQRDGLPQGDGWQRRDRLQRRRPAHRRHA